MGYFWFSVGPFGEQYKNKFIPNNLTRTDVKLGTRIGGPRKGTAEFQGNTLVTNFHEMVNGQDVLDAVGYVTVDPKIPNEMTYTLKDMYSGIGVIQKLYK